MTDDEFIKICNEAETMARACAKIGMHFNTFKRKALKLNCYRPNQSGKGTKKASRAIYPVSELIEGKHPHFQTYKLKQRLLNVGILKNECDACGLTETWNGKPLNMELDHIDGNSRNHVLDNLQMLCPNCHSQTDTFRSKNISYQRNLDKKHSSL
jgi:hypothetical protein